MAVLIALPETATILQEVGTSSQPVFNELLPIGLFIAGFIIGAIIVVMLRDGIIDAFGHFLHRKDKYE